MVSIIVWFGLLVFMITFNKFSAISWLQDILGEESHNSYMKKVTIVRWRKSQQLDEITGLWYVTENFNIWEGHRGTNSLEINYLNHSAINGPFHYGN